MEGPLFYKPQHADQRSLSCPWKRFHREEQSLRLSGHGRRTADAVRPTPVGRRSLRRTSRHAPPFFFLQLAPRRRSEGRSCVGRVGSAAAACRLCADCVQRRAAAASRLLRLAERRCPAAQSMCRSTWRRTRAAVPGRGLIAAVSYPLSPEEPDERQVPAQGCWVC